MESITVTVPAKLVLFGEYMVLRGFSATGTTLQDNHHIQIEERPAGLHAPLIQCQTHEDIDVDKSVQYVEKLWRAVLSQLYIPHCGVSLTYTSSFPPHYGWGGSSAIALSLIVLGYHIQQPGSAIDIVPQKLWRDYLLIKEKCGLAGSALDAYCQIKGGSWIPYTMGQDLQVEACDPRYFLNFMKTCSVYFIPTHQKANSEAEATRFCQSEIIQNRLQYYEDVMAQLLSAITRCDFESFKRAADELTDFIFSYVQAPLNYVHFFNKVRKWVGAAGVLKPCGALGGDGLLLFVREGDGGLLSVLRQNEILPNPLKLGGSPLCVQRKA